MVKFWRSLSLLQAISVKTQIVLYIFARPNESFNVNNRFFELLLPSSKSGAASNSFIMYHGRSQIFLSSSAFFNHTSPQYDLRTATGRTRLTYLYFLRAQHLGSGSSLHGRTTLGFRQSSNHAQIAEVYWVTGTPWATTSQKARDIRKKLASGPACELVGTWHERVLCDYQEVSKMQYHGHQSCWIYSPEAAT